MIFNVSSHVFPQQVHQVFRIVLSRLKSFGSKSRELHSAAIDSFASRGHLKATMKVSDASESRMVDRSSSSGRYRAGNFLKASV